MRPPGVVGLYVRKAATTVQARQAGEDRWTGGERQRNGGALTGEPIHRSEDFRFLKGAGRFIDDLKREGMLHAVVLRSSVAHGRIRGIDTKAARAMPGVHAVVTAAEIEEVPLIPLRLANLPEFK